MKKKLTVYSELVYIFGLLFTAFGVAVVEKADFGMSMIVAPSYILHLKLSQQFSFISFGVAEYFFQAFLILLTVILVRRFRLSYLFTFCTVILYGAILDLMIGMLSFFTAEAMILRILCFAAGLAITAFGVALMFHTYLSPEAYELLVKEVSRRYDFEVGRVKLIYDLSSCALSIILSFAFFGFGVFKGVGVGTVIAAGINGILIGGFSRFFKKRLNFKDAFKIRKYFE